MLYMVMEKVIKIMSKTVLPVILSTCIVILVNGENCDKLGTLLYEDLACTPVRKAGQECPIKYECGDFSKNGSCIFKGKSYPVNETAQMTEIDVEICYYSLFCQEPGTIMYIIRDCPEWFNYPPLKPNCYRTYDINQCCSVGMNCPSEDNTPGTCEVNGAKVREGEIFYAPDTCLKCVCPKDYQGTNEPSFCKRNVCNVQVHSSEQLEENCAPCYFKPNDQKLCCPNYWMCPSSSDTIIKINPSANSDSDLSCRFGTKELKLGEGFRREVQYTADSLKNITCECSLPPLLTCKET